MYAVKDSEKKGTYSDIVLTEMYAVKDWVKRKELIQTYSSWRCML